MEDFENSSAFVAILIIGVPLVFITIWYFVLWITSHMSGWRQLLKHYRSDSPNVTKWQNRGGGSVNTVKLPYAGMRGRLAVGANEQGMVIRAPAIIRLVYPDLFLPYEKIQREEKRTFLKLEFVTLTMQDAPDVQINLLESARDMAEAVRRA